MLDCKKCGNPDMPHNPCMCDDIGEMDTLVGMCATCCKYACTCERVGQYLTPQQVELTNTEVDIHTLSAIIDARGLPWVLAEISAYAGEQAANACRAPGNRNLSAWGTARARLSAMVANPTISKLAR